MDTDKLREALAGLHVRVVEGPGGEWMVSLSDEWHVLRDCLMCDPEGDA